MDYGYGDSYRYGRSSFNRLDILLKSYTVFLFITLIFLALATYPVPYFKAIAYSSIDIYRNKSGSIVSANSTSSSANVTDQLTVGLIGTCWRNLDQKIGQCVGGEKFLGFPGAGFTIQMEGFPDIDTIQGCMVPDFTTKIFGLQPAMFVVTFFLALINMFDLGFSLQRTAGKMRVATAAVLAGCGLAALISNAVIFAKFKSCVNDKTQYKARVSAGFWTILVLFGFLLCNLCCTIYISIIVGRSCRGDPQALREVEKIRSKNDAYMDDQQGYQEGY